MEPVPSLRERGRGVGLTVRTRARQGRAVAGGVLSLGITAVVSFLVMVVGMVVAVGTVAFTFAFAIATIAFSFAVALSPFLLVGLFLWWLF